MSDILLLNSSNIFSATVFNDFIILENEERTYVKVIDFKNKRVVLNHVGKLIRLDRNNSHIYIYHSNYLYRISLSTFNEEKIFAVSDDPYINISNNTIIFNSTDSWDLLNKSTFAKIKTVSKSQYVGYSYSAYNPYIYGKDLFELNDGKYLIRSSNGRWDLLDENLKWVKDTNIGNLSDNDILFVQGNNIYTKANIGDTLYRYIYQDKNISKMWGSASPSLVYKDRLSLLNGKIVYSENSLYYEINIDNGNTVYKEDYAKYNNDKNNFFNILAGAKDKKIIFKVDTNYSKKILFMKADFGKINII